MAEPRTRTDDYLHHAELLSVGLFGGLNELPKVLELFGGGSQNRAFLNDSLNNSPKN